MNKSPSMKSADTAFSNAIRYRDNYTCRFCGRIGVDIQYVDCAHVIPRREKITRWDARNAVTLCREHHRHFTDHPSEFREWVSAAIGKASLEELESLRRRVLKVNAARVKEIAAHYRAELRRMQKEKTHDLEPWVPYEAYALRA